MKKMILVCSQISVQPTKPKSMTAKQTSPSRWLAGITLFAIVLSIALPASAQTIWTNIGFNTVGLSTSWNTAANWNPNTVPNSAAAIAVITNNFGQTSHTNPLITLDAAITVNSLTYADTGKSNFSGTINAGSSGTLTFGGTTPTVDTLAQSGGLGGTLTNGTLTINATVTIPAGGLTKGTNVGNVILNSVSGGGPLTVNGGTLTVRVRLKSHEN